MPELPDITVYIEALKPRILGQRLERVRLANPFLLRSVETPIAEIEGLTATDLRRMGKRIVFGFENEFYVVLHLMIAGRLRWKKPETAIPRRMGLAAFDFSSGSLLLTEAGTKRRAALHVVKGEEGLAGFDRGGVEVLEAELPRFQEAMQRESHTLKRALTDPRLLSGIGNAYSDEILHRARLSPFKLTSKLNDEEMERLYNAARDTLSEWTERLMGETTTSPSTRSVRWPSINPRPRSSGWGRANPIFETASPWGTECTRASTGAERGPTWGFRTRSESIASCFIRMIPRSPMSRPRASCGAIQNNAGYTRRKTGARRGRGSCISTSEPAAPIWPWTPVIPTSFWPPCTSTDEHPGSTIRAARGRDST